MAKEKITPPRVMLNKVIEEKLVSDNDNNDLTEEKLYSGDFVSISNFTENKITNNETILDLFPDMELSIQILVSAILSPKDLTTPNLIFKSEDCIIPTDVKNTLLNNLKKYVNSNYNLTNKLSTILRESLFTKGSFIETYIPEASVNNIVNGNDVSLESFLDELDENKSFFVTDENNVSTLTDIEEMAKEDFDIDSYISFSDNISLLTAKDVYKKDMSKKVKKSLGIGFESRDDYNETYNKKMDTILNNIFKKIPVNEKNDTHTILTNDELNTTSIGMPMKMRLPVESVIPIHMPNDPSDHVGYFVLLGESGEPITKKTDWNHSDIDELLAINSKTILEKSKKALKGITETVPGLSNIGDLYGSIIDKKIINAVRNSNIKDLSEILDVSHIYRIMTARVLKKQNTRLLYIPEELVSFYAFNFRDNGTGESLLERVSMLASIRAMLLFARLMSFIKSSIINTKISAELDPRDPDPKKTMKRIITEAMKTRQTQLPFGVTKIDDLVDWSQKVGFSYEFKNHPGIPDMTMTTDDISTDKREPNTDLDDDIRKHIIMSFGLTPEIVDNGFNSDFASTVIANNTLLAKRVLMLQNIFTPQITSNVKKISNNDFKLRDELKNSIKENIKDVTKELSKDTKEEMKKMGIEDDYMVEWLLENFITNLDITLPKPEAYETNGLKDSYDEYKTAIEDELESFLSDDALPGEIFGEMSDDLDAFKTAAKNTLLRKWMSDNNYLGDLQNMLVKDKNGEPVLNVMEEYQNYIENLIDAMKPFLKDNVKSKKRADKMKKMFDEKYEAEEEEPVEETPPEENSDETPPEENSDETPPEENSDETPPKEESGDKEETLDGL